MIARRLFRLAAGLAAIAVLAAAPIVVEAHAGLVLASPGPGLGLAQAPAGVVIKFSEPLNLSLSRIEVLDASGADVGSGPTAAVAGDPAAMRRPLGLLPTGAYTVRWTSVSALDGHTLRGTYSFAVGTSASPSTTLADSPLDSEGPLGLIGRFVELVALGTWLASALLGRPSRLASLDATRTSRVRWLAPALAFGGTGLSLVSTTLITTGSLGAIGAVLASPSGEARLVVLAATALGVGLGARSTPATVALAAAAIVAETASGHAAASVLPPVAVASFAVHLVAVGVWIYAIAVSLLAAPSVRRALTVFSPYAIVAAALTAATGVANAILELADPADLITTGYGLVLVGKSLAFILMASFGTIHFLLRRRLTIPDGTLRGPVRAEAGAAIAALALATLLVGFPNPPREVEASLSELTASDPVLAELAGRDALSIAEASGPFVVGLTLLPPRPGTTQVRVQVLGVEPGDGLRNARFAASTGTKSAAVSLGESCGLGCFAGTTTFAEAGDWRLGVAIDSNRGPLAIDLSISLPTPDGRAALEGSLLTEEEVRSAVMTEKLRGSTNSTGLVSTYRFEAPDRAEITTNDTTQILAGQDLYQRTGSGPWDKTTFPAPGFSWPTGYYREFWGAYAAARILGPATVDGARTEILAFLRPDLPAWFRVWVRDSDGVIVRQEMRAEGHLMDQSYSELNGPISVEPPP